MTVPRQNERTSRAALPESDLLRLQRLAHTLNPVFGAGNPGQSLHRNAAGSGMEFRGFAEYLPGQDLRRVDWRASASKRSTYIRTFDDELSADWFICLDRSASMGRLDGRKWKLAIQLVSAFSYLLLGTGNRVGLVQFSAEVDQICPLGRGRRQYVRLVDELSRSQPSMPGGGSFLAKVRSAVRQQSHLIVVSDFLAADGMHAALAYLRMPGRRIDVVQVLSSSETDIATNGPQQLVDIESGEVRSVVSPEIARVAADHSLARLRQQLNEFCSRNHFCFTSAVSEQRWQDVMVGHLKRAG